MDRQRLLDTLAAFARCNDTPGNADYYPGTFYHKAEHAPDSEKLFQTDDQHPVYL